MNIEAHQQLLAESLRAIEESIEKGIVQRQRSIGFNTSAAAVDMLEILLHKGSLIDPGFVIKHDWFTSKKRLMEKFPFDFPNKERILRLMVEIEEKRNILCYGKPQAAEVLRGVISSFNALRELFEEAGIHEH